MRAKDVRIGTEYFARVSGRRVRLRILWANPRGGWDAVNCSTGRTIHVKSAGRLEPDPVDEESVRLARIEEAVQFLRRGACTEGGGECQT